MRNTTVGILIAGGLIAACLCVATALAGFMLLRIAPGSAALGVTATPLALPRTADPAPDAASAGASPEPVARDTSVPVPLETPDAAMLDAPGDAAAQRALLDQFCTTVADNYVDRTLNGVDWAAACAAVGGRIDAGISDAALFVALEALLDLLEDDHSAFIPRTRVSRVADSLGIDANRGDGGAAVVLTVSTGGPAHAAGVRAHDRVLAIDGRAPFGPNGAIGRLLRDAPMPERLTLSVASPGGQARDVVVRRDAATAPVDYAQISARLIEPGVALISVPSFAEPGAAGRVRELFAALTRENGGPLRALLLDLRTNGGGDISNLRDMLALFGAGLAGFNVTRDGLRAEVETRAEHEGNSGRLPIWILTSRHTDSSADVFAGVMQFWKRATLVGERTAGNTETVFTHQLGDGSAVRIAEMRFELPDGRTWDKRVGLTPDIAVPERWEDYTTDADPVLARAVAATR
jgi:carboxyl-terminal processing protease